MVSLYLEMESRLNDEYTDESTMKMVLDRICAYFDKEDSDFMESIMNSLTTKPEKTGVNLKLIISHYQEDKTAELCQAYFEKNYDEAEKDLDLMSELNSGKKFELIDCRVYGNDYFLSEGFDINQNGQIIKTS